MNSSCFITDDGEDLYLTHGVNNVICIVMLCFDPFLQHGNEYQILFTLFKVIYNDI